MICKSRTIDRLNPVAGAIIETVVLSIITSVELIASPPVLLGAAVGEPGVELLAIRINHAVAISNVSDDTGSLLVAAIAFPAVVGWGDVGSQRAQDLADGVVHGVTD